MELNCCLSFVIYWLLLLTISEFAGSLVQESLSLVLRKAKMLLDCAEELLLNLKDFTA